MVWLILWVDSLADAFLYDLEQSRAFELFWGGFCVSRSLGVVCDSRRSRGQGRSRQCQLELVDLDLNIQLFLDVKIPRFRRQELVDCFSARGFRITPVNLSSDGTLTENHGILQVYYQNNVASFFIVEYTCVRVPILSEKMYCM